MRNAFTLPPPDHIAEQIRLRRDEITALKKLFRASKAAVDAEAAKAKQIAVPLALGGRNV